MQNGSAGSNIDTVRQPARLPTRGWHRRVALIFLHKMVPFAPPTAGGKGWIERNGFGCSIKNSSRLREALDGMTSFRPANSANHAQPARGADGLGIPSRPLEKWLHLSPALPLYFVLSVDRISSPSYCSIYLERPSPQSITGQMCRPCAVRA